MNEARPKWRILEIFVSEIQEIMDFRKLKKTIMRFANVMKTFFSGGTFREAQVRLLGGCAHALDFTHRSNLYFHIFEIWILEIRKYQHFTVYLTVLLRSQERLEGHRGSVLCVLRSNWANAIGFLACGGRNSTGSRV